METEESELKWNKVQDALVNLPLTWATIGDYIIVMNNKPDIMIGGEPHLALQLWFNTRSGQIIGRVWNQTVSSSNLFPLTNTESLKYATTILNKSKYLAGIRRRSILERLKNVYI